jgi:CBS domain-containing protein
MSASGVTVSAGARFLAAFNEIESYFRKALSVDEHVEFTWMAQEYAARKHLPREYRDALLAFGRLRNAISHERYYGGRPVAEPVPQVVEQIERLREKIITPPAALSVLGTMDVCTIDPDEPINVALEYFRRFDYSQLPVYEAGRYVGILTTNAVARWLAGQLAASGGLAECEPVHRVLGFTEPHESALHVPRTITAAAAIGQFSTGHAGKPAAALIVTESGKVIEKPLAIVVADDLPALMGALAIS